MYVHPSIRRLHIIALAQALITLSTAQAGADGPDHFAVTGVSQGDVLNMRAAPGARSAKVGVIPPNGACLRNLGCQEGLSLQDSTSLSSEQRRQRMRDAPRWCRIEYSGQQGWVAGRYLREDSSGSCVGR